jgi:hypothetical protein
MKTEKNWADALREQCFPEEVSPSPGSWAGISGKMHRRTVRRWSLAAALALLIPSGGILLFRPAPSVTHPVAVLERPVLESQPELLAALPPEGRVVSLQSRKPVRKEEVVSGPTEPAVPPREEPVVVPAEEAEVIDTEPVNIDPTPSGPETEEWFPVETEQAAPRKRRLSVTLQGGSATGQRDSYPLQEYAKRMSVQSKAANIYWNNLINNVTYYQLHYRHDPPLSLGLAVRWDFSTRMALESGLTYTYLHSYEEQAGHQQLHFLGIPLKLDVRLFSIGPLDVGAGALGMAEKCLSAVQGGISYAEPTLQWSAGAFVDAAYRLGPHASLYFQPSLSYYFTKTTLITYRTENPFSFTLQAGLRFHL